MEEEKKEHEHHEHISESHEHHEHISESHEHHEPVSEHHKKFNFTEKVRKNPWILISLVLGILLIILLISTFSGKLSGKVISEDQIGEKLLKYYTDNGASNLSVASVTEVSGVYVVNFLYQNQIVPMYITKDGTLVGSLSEIDLTGAAVSGSDSTATEIPTSDKPTVELYVFTYCPYGLQMEKAILPVVTLLGDSIDFKIRQIGAMHGDYEKVEAERQLCIEKNYPAKFLDYVLAFAEDSSIGDCDGDATCLAPLLSSLYTKLGMSASTINSCMTSEGETLYEAEVANAQSAGVSGSPTLIINGVTASTSRNPEAIKEVICAAFNEAPSACSETLSTTASSAGFGSSSSSSSSSSATC